MEWKLIDRFKEPSSYAALGGLLVALGVNLPSGAMQALTYLGCAVCLGLGVIFKEGTKAP